jgi:cytoskeletal protein CcmA (bactofilin family)
MADANQEYATVLGADAHFKGDLTFESGAKLLGQFEGSIKSKGRVHVAKGSECRATVIAKEVAVEGRIEGNVEAGDKIELKPDGIVEGDVTAGRMTMAEGASINGYCRIGPNGKNSSSTELKPRAAASTKAETAKA